MYHVRPDTVRLYTYGDRIKAVYFKAGVRRRRDDVGLLAGAAGVAPDGKLTNSISRSRRRVYELAACNPWDWFATLTIDGDKLARNDLVAFRKSFAQWIRNQCKKHNCSIKYLLVPELHKDGQNWHMHGLFHGLPEGQTPPFVAGQAPQRLIDAGYHNWPAYAEKYGYVSMGKIRDPAAVAGYIAKYISKDIGAADAIGSGQHLYYASQGLQCAALRAEGRISVDALDQLRAEGWENDYCIIRWYDADETPLIVIE